MSRCTYCREVGHTKSVCPALSKKIEAKKAKREDEKKKRRFTGIVKKFGATPEALFSLWKEASSVVGYFLWLEKEAERTTGAEFDLLCERLAAREEEYEDQLAFMDFLDSSDFNFEKKKCEVVEKSGSLYEALGSLSENKPEEISKSNAEEPFNEEELMIRASNHYWKMRYRYGERVFFGWLDGTREKNSRMKEIFSGRSWTTEKPKDVFKIGENTEKARKPKVFFAPVKKKSQRERRKALV